MDSMFYNCSSLTSLDLSNFITQKVDNIQSIIGDCTKLKYVNLDNLVGNVTKMQLAFRNCYSLEYMNLPIFKSDKVTEIFNFLKIVIHYYILIYLVFLLNW